MPNMAIGVQLYTLRDLTAKGFARTVNAVAKLGYSSVELAGYGDLKTPGEVKKALDDAGLKAPAGHWAIDVLEKEAERIKDEAQLLGVQTVVVPYLAEERRKDADGYKRTAELLNEIGNAFHGVGIELGYHNHSFEFQKFEGKYGLDILYENTMRHLVTAEIDVYWVKHGGVDPAAYIDQLGDRVRLLHLKDMGPAPEMRFAEVGTGSLDFNAILAAAEKHGVQWGMVEQDNTYDTPPLDAIRTSYENLKKLGAA